MIPDSWAAFRGKRILLLQGPVGPFFGRLARRLASAGAEVHKVNFNGGDWVFYPSGAMPWRGSQETWPDHFESLLERLSVDMVVMFGDCRPIHRPAREIALRRGVRVGVFEEGYVRPNFITFEPSGVNAHSRLPRSVDICRVLPDRPTPAERSVGYTFHYAALWATLYYLAASVLYPWFRRYRHHRPLTLLEAWPWLRSGGRKLRYAIAERRILGVLTGVLSRKYFLVPLQVPSDSQVLEHSGFVSVEGFIDQVVASFAAHAPHDTTLVIKHHPLDRGYHEYGRLIAQLGQQFGLGCRLLYIHDLHLPTLFEHMRGAVVINSTVGFSALTHWAPVKACGRALYDIPGLTFQGPLHDFWHGAADFRLDAGLFRRFRTYLINQTQLNASFYRGSLNAPLCLSIGATLGEVRVSPADDLMEMARQTSAAGPASEAA